MKKQKGLNAVELTALVAVALVGVGVWYVWQATSKPQASETLTPQTELTDKVATETADVGLATRLSSLNNIFSMQLPDGWHVTNDTKQAFAAAIGIENLTYKKGVPATVTDEIAYQGGGTPRTRFSVRYGSVADLGNYFINSQQTGTLTTGSGLQAAKYLYVAPEGSELTAGAKNYGFKITKNDHVIIVNYLVLPTDIPELTAVEAAVATLNFN